MLNILQLKNIIYLKIIKIKQAILFIKNKKKTETETEIEIGHQF